MKNQTELSKFVSNNVFVQQSALIEHLFEKEVFSFEDISNGFEYHCLECSSTLKHLTESERVELQTPNDLKCLECQTIYSSDDMEAQLVEIFEWWVCSDWLIEQLKKEGQPVLDTDYGAWWGRTCTGQAIYMDSVIEKIAK